MKIAFIGLGQMGKPMAINLSKCGKELIVNDISDQHSAEFNERGIKTTKDINDIVKCDIIFLCLPDDNIVKNVLFGEKGIAPLLNANQIICDLSTINYTTATEIAKKLTALNIKFMDAPVSGMEARAIDGTLTIMCGGELSLYQLLLPYLECMGNNILFMGTYGCGQLTKALNNILFDINIAAFAEIFPVAIKLGLDPCKIASVINNSSGRSYASEFFLPRILKRNFSDGYPLSHAYKDLICGAEISAQLGFPMPVMHAATTTYQMALLEGLGAKDKGAMTCVFERLLKVECKN